MRNALHLLAAALFVVALYLARAGVWLLPWRPAARVMRRWSISVATLATRARSAARGVR